ncbi:MAG: ABC transporter ATP-binding protein [Rhodobacteraceae bacterium]|nr:ABC transporter ATP-binding protein [Paracoccaceae bacterium]
MLTVRNVSKNFGGVRAVSDVSFSVGATEIHGLIGPNGAGKTTMINLVSGVLSISEGTIMLGDREIQKMPTDARARIGVSRTFQNLRLFNNLTVRRNIEVAEIHAGGRDKADPDLITDAITRFGLENVLEASPTSLPYGQMRRLEIVRALALRPKLLMLDEPAAGMNSDETDELFDNIKWIRERHPCAIVLIEHDLKFVLSVCDNLTVMNMGSLLASGTPQQITTNPEVIEAYLGYGPNS